MLLSINTFIIIHHWNIIEVPVGSQTSCVRVSVVIDQLLFGNYRNSSPYWTTPNTIPPLLPISTFHGMSCERVTLDDLNVFSNVGCLYYLLTGSDILLPILLIINLKTSLEFIKVLLYLFQLFEWVSIIILIFYVLDKVKSFYSTLQCIDFELSVTKETVPCP